MEFCEWNKEGKNIMLVGKEDAECDEHPWLY